MVDIDDDDTTPTEQDGVLDQLRREGILGPFVVVDSAGGSDIGLTRAINEDAWCIVADSLFVVADGIGGHEGGALAASTAVKSVTEYGVGMTEVSGRALAASVNRAVVEAGERTGLDQLGTTLVVVAAHRNHVVVLSAGDSRVYRMRGGELEQLTSDHTVRNELVESGVPLEMARQSNIRLDALTSYMGRHVDNPTIHLASYSVMAGDRFLMCTDGVHGQLTSEVITLTMTAGSCGEIIDALLQRARDAGGRDNATAVVVDFDNLTEGEDG